MTQNGLFRKLEYCYKVSEFQNIMVSRFLDFKDPGSQGISGIKVTWFLSFKVLMFEWFEV
jgi:hypothetical protein